MIARSLCVVLLVLAGWACDVAVAADLVEEFAQHIVVNTKRRNCWPQPFVCPDRATVRAPLVIMVHNGWRRQNMLDDYHFDPSTNQLTEAGQLKVRWVLTEAPTQHREVYIHRADTAESRAARMDNVQQFVAKVLPEGNLPPVLETDIPARGWPASRVDLIGRKFDSSTPNPRLPEATGNAEAK